MKCVRGILQAGIWVSIAVTAGAQAIDVPASIAPARASASRLNGLIERIETLQLVENKVYLYRQAADALAGTSKPQAAELLLRALGDLDAAQLSLRGQQAPDRQVIAELDFARRPVILQLVRIQPSEGLRVLEQPQPADMDTEFQRLVYEQAGDPAAIAALAQRKLSYGVTPATIAAYAVLQQKDAPAARTLIAEIVGRLGKQDPVTSPAAVQSAFALLRLLRSDEGTRAPRITIDASRIDDHSVAALFGFIADALVTAKQPELLVLPETPKLYVQAIGEYAPAKADEVKALPFAAPDAKSLIFAKDTLDGDGQPAAPPPARTPEQQQENAARQQQFLAQLRETAAQFETAKAALADTRLKPAELDKAVWSAVDAANKSIAMARGYDASLEPREFRDGEYQLDTSGPLIGVTDSVSSILKSYAGSYPAAAAKAAEGLDGNEMQLLVELELALRPASQDAARSRGQ